MKKIRRVTCFLSLTFPALAIFSACDQAGEITQPSEIGSAQSADIGMGDLNFHFPDLRALHESSDGESTGPSSIPTDPGDISGGPALVLRCQPDDPDCGGDDGGGTMLSNEEWAARNPARVYDEWTVGSLATVTDVHGHHMFEGTHGTIETDMYLLYEEAEVAHREDDDSYSFNAMDWFNFVTSACWATFDPETGNSYCDKPLDTHLHPVTLTEDCGHRMEMYSTHTAKVELSGARFSDDEKNSKGEREQDACDPGVDEGDSGTGNPEGDNQGICQMYECLVWYWVDTGIIFRSICWCEYVA